MLNLRVDFSKGEWWVWVVSEDSDSLLLGESESKLHALEAAAEALDDIVGKLDTLITDNIDEVENDYSSRGY